MTDILNHLPALRVFEAVARLGSVRLAASELAVTDGAVSKQIKALERELKTALFIRGHRRLILTEPAERLAASLTGSFKAIVRATDQLERTSRRTNLVIAGPSTFLVRWFMPRLARLEARVHGTSIGVTAWNKDLSATDRSIDIHVVVGTDASMSGMTREIVGPETFGPVVRADLVDRAAPPEAVLGLRRLTTAWPTAMWRNWALESGHDLGDIEELRFERLLFAVEAAEAGMGAVLAPGPSVWDGIAAGRLAAPLGLCRREGNWALTWRTDQTSGLYMSVLRWFQKEFEDSARNDPSLG